MTIRELEQIGDNWHGRIQRLITAVHNQDATEEKREKAFRLWLTMTRRVTRLTMMLNEARAQKFKDLKPGGIVAGGTNSPYVEQGEFVIPREKLTSDLFTGNLPEGETRPKYESKEAAKKRLEAAGGDCIALIFGKK